MDVAGPESEALVSRDDGPIADEGERTVPPPSRWRRIMSWPLRGHPLTRIIKVTALVLGALLAFSVLITLPWRWLTPPTTAFIMIKEDGEQSSPTRRWVSWDNISPSVPMAIIAAEDQKFATHDGFDLESIRESLDTSAGTRRGASTISQQLAKNLYLWPGRSWVRKGLEAYLTVFIETLWPKRRILEIYMNVVEFGPGIFGVGSASEVYFGKTPKHLNRYEAALLAAVLPSPRRMSPGRPSPYVVERAMWIMEQAAQLGGSSYLETM